MKPLIIVGAIILLLGLWGIAMPVFTTHETEEVAKLGDIKVQSQKENVHAVPVIVSEGAIVLRAILVGAGLFARRS